MVLQTSSGHGLVQAKDISSDCRCSAEEASAFPCSRLSSHIMSLRWFSSRCDTMTDDLNGSRASVIINPPRCHRLAFSVSERMKALLCNCYLTAFNRRHRGIRGWTVCVSCGSAIEEGTYVCIGEAKCRRSHICVLLDNRTETCLAAEKRLTKKGKVSPARCSSVDICSVLIQIKAGGGKGQAYVDVNTETHTKVTRETIIHVSEPVRCIHRMFSPSLTSDRRFIRTLRKFMNKILLSVCKLE